MSESCNSRHFTWLTKSCFPNPQQQPHQPHRGSAVRQPPVNPQSTISSLPEDLLLECLSRVPHSTLPSISLVCRRWAHLVDSSDFYDLRRRRGRLRLTVFAVAVTDSGLHTASHRFGQDSSWKIASFLPRHDVVDSPGIFHGLSSQSRLSAIGRKMYIIGRTAMIRCDTWTGTVTAKSGMIFPRKKFAAAVVGNKIYIAGGSARTSAVEQYDPCHDTWRVVSDAPRRRYGCLGASVDGIFYVIGGLKIGSSGNEFSRAGAEAHLYACSMDLYDVEARAWLRSRAIPGGGCVVAACAAEGHVYVLASHAVELSFWRFDARRKVPGGTFGEWSRIKSPPLPAQVRLDGTVRFSCVGVGDKVVLVQVWGCIDDLLRRGGSSTRGLREALVVVYDSAAGEWSRAADMPEVIRRAACVCVEC